MTQKGIKFFWKNDLEIAQMTFGQCHDTPLGYKQSLCEVRTSNIVDQIDMDWTRILHRQGQSDWQTNGHGDFYITPCPLTSFKRGMMTFFDGIHAFKLLQNF